MTDGTDKRGQRAAYGAAIGAGIGTGLGAGVSTAIGIYAIAIFAIFGAVSGMLVGYFYKGSDGSER